MINIDSLIQYTDEKVYSPSDDTYLLLDYFNTNITTEKLDGLKLGEVHNILDMGTGTGIIAIFFQLLRRKLNAFTPQIFASDILEEAIICAKRNENFYDFTEPITFIKSDLFMSFPSKWKHKFEIITFNPPYLPSFEYNQSFEKKKEDLGWDGGIEGYELFLRFLEDVPDYLNPNEDSRVYYISSSRVDLQTFHNLIEKKGFENKILDKTHIFFEDILLSMIKPI